MIEARPLKSALSTVPPIATRLALLCLGGVISFAAQADGPGAVYLIGGDRDAIHLSDRSSGPADVVLIAAPALPKLAAPEVRRPSKGTAEARLGDAAAVAAFDRIVATAAAANALDPNLVRAVIATESGYSVRAVSRRGALGLMQLMPATARAYGVTDAFNIGQNVTAGASHLRSLLDQFDQDMVLALAAYNAGAAAVIRHGRTVPPFSETRAYVPRVLRYLAALRQPAHPAPTA